MPVLHTVLPGLLPRLPAIDDCGGAPGVLPVPRLPATGKSGGDGVKVMPMPSAVKQSKSHT